MYSLFPTRDKMAVIKRLKAVQLFLVIVDSIVQVWQFLQFQAIINPLQYLEIYVHWRQSHISLFTEVTLPNLEHLEWRLPMHYAYKTIMTVWFHF
jgi:hypothetical protein